MGRFFTGLIFGILLAVAVLKITEKNKKQIAKILSSWKKILLEGDGAVSEFLQKKKNG